MGLPVNSTTAVVDKDESGSADTEVLPAPSGRPRSTAELPPAALDLAAKLFDLARGGDTATLATYLDAGVPKNLTNHNGDTLLMLAAYHDHPQTVLMLLRMGADPNVLNGRGQSPIAGAVFKGYAEVVKILVDNGADVMAGQPSAPDTARMFRRPDLLRILGIEDGTPTEGGPVGQP